MSENTPIVRPWRIDELLKGACGEMINQVRNSALSRVTESLHKDAINAAARGLGNVVNAAIDQHPGIPHRAVDAIEIAQAVGILPKDRKRRRNPRRRAAE